MVVSGELEMADVFMSHTDSIGAFGHILVLLFVIAMTLLFINLLIGLAVAGLYCFSNEKGFLSFAKL